MPLLEQVAVAPVRLRGGAEPRVLAHRPEPPAVSAGVQAARERVAAGLADASRSPASSGPYTASRGRSGRRPERRAALRLLPPAHRRDVSTHDGRVRGAGDSGRPTRRTRPRRWLQDDASVGAARQCCPGSRAGQRCPGPLSAPAIRSTTCSPMRGPYAAASDDRSSSPRSLGIVVMQTGACRRSSRPTSLPRRVRTTAMASGGPSRARHGDARREVSRSPERRDIIARTSPLTDRGVGAPADFLTEDISAPRGARERVPERQHSDDRARHNGNGPARARGSRINDAADW